MDKRESLVFPLTQFVVDFAQVERQHHLAGTDQRENDVEHSFSVAVLCWYIHDTYDVPLDLSKILRYALVHDFVERYAGDTSAFATPEERAQKLVREAAALEELGREFSGFPDMVETVAAYEAKADEEALFVWTVDKLQALIMGDMDNWRPYRELGISYQAFDERYTEVLEKASPYGQEIFAGLMDYFRSSYFDRPTDAS